MRNNYCLRSIYMLLFMLCAYISSNAQTTYNFDAGASISIPPGGTWNTLALVTIGGINYKLTSFGNGGFSNSATGGTGDSPSLQKTGSGGDTFVLERADGLPFTFYSMFLREESISSYASSFPGIPPWYTVTYNKTVGAIETEEDNTAVSGDFFTTGTRNLSRTLVVTSVSIFFQANSRYWVDDIRVGIATGTEVAPTVTSTAPSAITSSSATMGGNVTADGGAAVTDRGIVWSTGINPTTSNNKVGMGSNVGAFSGTVGSLPFNTTIHFRAYAINTEGTSYGADLSFNTLAPTVIVNPATAPGATVGVAYSQTFTGSGGTAPYGFVVSAGTVPTSLSLNTTSGALTGIPTSSGTFNFTIRATDASGNGGPFSGTRAYTVTVAPPTIVIAPATVPNGTVAIAYNQTITASGGIAPYSYAITSGALPAGVSLSSAGVMSGTATAGGTFNFIVTATGSSTGTGSPHSGSRAYALTIAAPTIVLNPVTLPGGSIGAAYLQTVTATGGTGPRSFAITAGALPADLSLSSAGALTGTPSGGGTYNFTVTATDASGGTGPFTGSRSYSMVIAAPTIVVNPASLPSSTVGAAYSQTLTSSGGTAPYFYSITSGTLPFDLSLTNSGVLSGTPTVGGSYTFDVKSTDASLGSGPYSTTKTYNVNVNFLPQAITFAATATANYGDADIDPGATNDSGLPISYSTSDPGIATIVAGKVHVVGAGTVNIFADQAGNGTYSPATQKTQALTISKAVLTYTADGASKVYGSANPAFTGTVTGFKYADNLGNATTGSVAFGSVATNLTTIGTYAVNGNGLTAANYSFTQAVSNAAALSITQKAITVTATAGQNKVYGSLDPTLAYTITTGVPLIGTDAFTGTLSRAPGENVGTYAINQGSLILNANYTLTYVGSNFAISAKAITVAANAGQTKIYGTLDPTFAYSITAGAPLVGADTFTGALGRATGENVGNYAISQGSLALSANYSLNVTSSNFAITPKAVTVIASAGQNKTYGQANPTYAYAITAGGPLVTGDAFTGTLTRAAGENVGPYSINQGSLALSSNYALNYVGANFVINPATLTIRADNKERFFGGANPTLTASYSGFVNGETNTVLTTQPALATLANTASAIGDYPITVNGAAALNYTITYVNGVLKVKAGAPTNIILAGVTLYENRPAGTNAGSLSSTSDDLSSTFTYSLVTGSGDTDNALFAIAGTNVNTASSLNFEQKASYSLRVRSTTQYGLSLDKVFTISLSDVNEAPTLAAIVNLPICYTTAAQILALSGISAGPESGQITAVSVSSNNAALFESLDVSSSGATGSVNYRIKSAAIGTATVTVTVKDNGGNANNGTDTFSQTFTVTVNPLPVLAISSDKGSSIGKGEVVLLTATGANNYAWAGSNGIISGGNSAVLTIRPTVTTTYTLTGTNTAGCSQVQGFTVTVLDDLTKIKSTNILTPNNDGFNDKWIVENIDVYPDNEVRVFDKAGRVVYTKKGYDNSWDGNMNGTALSEDTYYYVIDFGTSKAKLRGYITLIREN
jgi:gliding motility-associated-like protein